MNLTVNHFTPEVESADANCGPTVLAALLGVNTDRAIADMDKHYKNGWHGYSNVGHIRAALVANDIKMEKIRLDPEMKRSMAIEGLELNTHYLCFIIIDGPWTEKGWRSQYNHTHWALFYKGRVMDINNCGLPSYKDDCRVPWTSVQEWRDEVVPGIIAWDEGTGWSIRSIYKITDKEDWHGFYSGRIL